MSVFFTQNWNKMKVDLAKAKTAYKAGNAKECLVYAESADKWYGKAMKSPLAMPSNTALDFALEIDNLVDWAKKNVR